MRALPCEPRVDLLKSAWHVLCASVSPLFLRATGGSQAVVARPPPIIAVHSATAPLHLLRDTALRRRVVAVCVFALLLKLAVPLLAAWAARLSHVPVSEICSVYGVDLSAHHHHHHHGHHGNGPPEATHDDDCPLTGVAAAAALVMSLTALLLAVIVWSRRSAWRTCLLQAPPDGTSAWRSKLAHAPPRAA